MNTTNNDRIHINILNYILEFLKILFIINVENFICLLNNINLYFEYIHLRIQKQRHSIISALYIIFVIY